MRLGSQVIITSNIPETVLRLEALQQGERFVKIIKEDTFLVEDAKLAIEKAYMAVKRPPLSFLQPKHSLPLSRTNFSKS